MVARTLAATVVTVILRCDFCATKFIGNGQLSLIFGVPNFGAFSLRVLCLLKLQVEAKTKKN